MAKCLQKTFSPAVAKQKAQKATVYIEATDDGGTCNVFEARSTVNATGFVSSAYNAQKSVDLSSVCSSNCGGGSFGGVSSADPVVFENSLNFNATEVALGVHRVPMYFASAGTYTVTYDITDIASAFGTTGNSYTETVTVAAAGWQVVDFDLAAGPDALLTSAWVPSALGAQSRVTVSGLTVGDEVRIGSIELYESREDIKTNGVFVGLCTTAIEPSQSRSRNTDDCGETDWDTSGKENTISLTINKRTANDYLLDVTAEKEREVSGYMPISAEATVEAVTINGIDFGKVQFSDIYNNGCGLTAAYIDGNCGKVNLERVSSVTPMQLGDNEYQILDGVADPSQIGTFLVDDTYVGSTMTVTYLKAMTVKRSVSGDEIQPRRYRAWYSLEDSNNVTKVYELEGFAPTSSNIGAASGTETTAFTVEATYDRMITSRAV